MPQPHLALLALLVSMPAVALAGDDDTPYEDFRISGSILLGAGSNPAVGQTLSANLHAGVFIPIYERLGLRAGATFLSQPSFGAAHGGGAGLIGFGGGPDYTLRFGDSVWGLGMAAGVEYVPFGFIDPGSGQPHTSIAGANFYQELALRRVVGIGLWALGVRGDEFFGSGETITNVGAFFRFSFRL